MKFYFLLLVLLQLLGSESCSGLPQRERSDQDPSENSSTAHHGSSSSNGSSSNNKRRGQTSTRNNNAGVGIVGEVYNDAKVRTMLLSKWVPAALKYFEFSRCTATNIGSEDECFKLAQIKRDQIAVYFAYSSNRFGNGPTKSSSGKVFAILPDSNNAKSSGAHDAVLVLDPYPNSPFGHLIAMFYLDWVSVEGAAQCKDQFQTLASDGTCITVGRKHRCPNLLERFTSSGLHALPPKRCHVDFLPTVYSSERVNLPLTAILQGETLLSRYPDLLECIPNLPGFAACPKLRPVEDTAKVLCDSALANSKRCDTTHATVGTSCKLFQSCDRAVLIGGGWNRAHSPALSLNNMRIMAESLQGSGFSPENIKTFYANGKLTPARTHPTTATSRATKNANNNNGDYFSSAMKTALRGHIRTTCDNRHCADTLFIYLNNPTTFEGDFLLWDMDGNGMADELEVYSVKEFLSDLAGCEAKRVVVMVEQANSDILMASLKSSLVDHGNVILLSAGLPNEVLQGGEFTQSWVNSSTNPTACLRHVYQITASYMKGSNPVFYDPTNGISSKLSLVGAPCDLSPPVSQKELRTMYQGCQNVPTSIWFSFDFEEMGGGGEIGVEMEESSKEELLEGGSLPDGDGDNNNNGSFSSVDQEFPRRERPQHHRRHSMSKRRRRARSRLSRAKMAASS